MNSRLDKDPVDESWGISEKSNDGKKKDLDEAEEFELE